MYDEDDLIPLSALSHFLFCPRRAFLVHVERLWEENQATAEGNILHHKTDLPLATESRGVVRIARQINLRSARLGLTGIADLVEFHLVKEGEGSCRGVRLVGASGAWCPYPVEYKRGLMRTEEGYEVQLCAQAICLEEILGIGIPAGALYFGKNRRRKEVIFTDSLKRKTETSTRSLHELFASIVRPTAEHGPKCKHCSIVNLCLPQVSLSSHSVESFLSRMLKD